MLDIHQPPPSSDTKTYFSHSVLPAYIDPLHTSGKKNPFATFLAQPYSHTLDLLVAADVASKLHTDVASKLPTDGASTVYARAWLKLSDILDNDFLDAYVRNKSAALLSDGRGETRFTLSAGMLRIEMERQVYERAGLVGVAVEDGGRKHSKSKWAVEVDLTKDSMRSGKKGFERVAWAARNVLDQSRSVLFSCANPSFGQTLAEGREVLARHAPTLFTVLPVVTQLPAIAVPRLDDLSVLHEQDDALALLEWLDLTCLASARVGSNNTMDAHLSRYEAPDLGHAIETRDLVRMRWSGFITPDFAKDLFLAVWNAGYKRRRDDGSVSTDSSSDTPREWFAMSAQAFGGREAWSLVQLADRETLVWEVEG